VIPTWEAVLTGVLVLVLLLWFVPGVKESVRRSRKGTAEDWRGVLLPLGLVALFVVLLLATVA